MKALQPAVLIALLILLAPAHALQLYTEEYPPLSYSHEGSAKGLASDVVRELLKRLNLEADIHVTPWARAYHSALHTPNTAAFVTMRTPERENLFKWVGPIMLTTDSFYALKDSDIVVRNDEELNAVKGIAVPRDWFTYQELHAKGMKNLLDVTDPAQMFELLRQGRVPLILTDNLSFFSKGEAATLVGNLTHDDVKSVYPYRQAYGYISFWKGTDDKEIKRWQSALDDMKRDGTFSRIYQHWLPGEEEPSLYKQLSLH
jgi:polar amino acid transport system substrate-binding protein